MTWLKLDDAFADHPKVMAAGPLASWLHVCGLLYCSRLLTDGFIPAGQVRKLADVDDAIGLAEQLVAVGLWDVADGGYQVHDYLDFNPTREEALQRREHISEVRRDAGRAGGVASAKARAKAEPFIKEATEPNDEANCLTVADDTVKQNASPVPIPYPSRPQPTPEPREKPPRARAKPATRAAGADAPPRRDAVFEALATSCYGKYQGLTKDERGKVNAAVASLRATEMTDEELAAEIPRRHRLYPKLYPELGEPSPTAISGNWTKLGNLASQNGHGNDLTATERSARERDELGRALAAAGILPDTERPGGGAVAQRAAG